MQTLVQSPEVTVQTDLQSDGTLTVHSVVEDQGVLAKNAEIRNSRLVVPGRNAAPCHPDGARIIWWFQVHPVLWHRHRRRYPGLHKALHSHEQIAREKAAAEIARQHPEWVCAAPKVSRQEASQ